MRGFRIGQFPNVTDNAPPKNGTYAVEIYWGWKLLEWHNGEWWHTERVGRWTASEPLQWVGPLPPLVGQKGAETPEKVFDL